MEHSVVIFLLGLFLLCIRDAVGDWCGESRPISGSHTLETNCTLTAAIAVTGTLSINGIMANGTLVRIIGGSGRIFTVANNGNLRLSNVILEGGSPSGTTVMPECTGCGGAIHIRGPNTTLLVENSTFLDNTAKWGGAIYAARGIVELDRVTVINSGGTIDGEPFHICHGLVSAEVAPLIFWEGTVETNKFYTYEGWKCNGSGTDSNVLMGYTRPFVKYLYSIDSNKIVAVFNRKVTPSSGFDTTPFQLFVNGDGKDLTTATLETSEATDGDSHLNLTLTAMAHWSGTANLTLTYSSTTAMNITSLAGGVLHSFKNKEIYNNG